MGMKPDHNECTTSSCLPWRVCVSSLFDFVFSGSQEIRLVAGNQTFLHREPSVVQQCRHDCYGERDLGVSDMTDSWTVLIC